SILWIFSIRPPRWSPRDGQDPIRGSLKAISENSWRVPEQSGRQRSGTVHEAIRDGFAAIRREFAILREVSAVLRARARPARKRCSPRGARAISKLMTSALGFSEPSLLDLQRSNLRFEGRGGHAEPGRGPRRAGYLPFAARQRGFDHLSLVSRQ